jgi:hypothetical protein
MKKDNLKKQMEKLRKWDQLDGGNFLYNFMSGYVLFARGKYKTAQETLLAKCFYCQALEHDGEAGDCPNTDCPLLRFMCEKKYKGKDREVYP